MFHPKYQTYYKTLLSSLKNGLFLRGQSCKGEERERKKGAKGTEKKKGLHNKRVRKKSPARIIGFRVQAIKVILIDGRYVSYI